MEESNLINNDNTYNTDMSTSQSTISGNATTNNKFNKDDLQEVTGGGIVTQSTTIVYGTETSQATGTLTPIILILGDGTTTPDVDEEPVLLEEDITYNAVINSEYKDRVPTIKLDGSEVSYCDANYIIAVTETDETIPVIYDSQNLSKTFTNNGDNWCSVIFKSPLEVADQLKLPLNSDNFLDNSKIIVPVISCEENNTGQERNTTITFNIKNFAISHNIQMNVIQETLTQQLVPGPCVLKYVSGYVQGEDDQTKYTYKILSNNTYYIFKNRGSSYIYENENDPEKVDNFKFYLLFGIVDDTNNIYDNLQATDNTELKDNYANSITSSKTNYKLTLLYETQVFRRRTAAIMYINIPDDAELQDVITFSYNNKQFMTLKYVHQDQKNTIIARAKWDGQTISIIHDLYFLTDKNPKKEIKYESHVLNAPMTLDNIIFLIDNKYQINVNTDKKILRNVLTQYNLEHNSGYDFNSYMDYYVMDISDCINDIYRNYVYLKDIEEGDPFANFKIYIYTRNNQSEYVYLGYIATVEPYNDAYETFIGFFDKK